MFYHKSDRFQSAAEMERACRTGDFYLCLSEERPEKGYGGKTFKIDFSGEEVNGYENAHGGKGPQAGEYSFANSISGGAYSSGVNTQWVAVHCSCISFIQMEGEEFDLREQLQKEQVKKEQVKKEELSRLKSDKQLHRTLTACSPEQAQEILNILSEPI